MIKTESTTPAPQIDRTERTPPVGVKWHPYAEIFPWIDGPAFEDLVEDIRKHGVLEPIVFLDGAVLDGRNRYMAARELGIEYPRVEYTGDDPLGFVISHNLKRRHLTESQRGMVAKRLETMKQGRPSGKDANLHVSREQAAALLNVSPRTVATAAKVMEQGAPELVAAVESGQVSVSAAVEIAALPKEEQMKVVASGSVKEAAKEQRGKRASERKAEQAKNDQAREAARAALPESVQRIEQARQRNGSANAAVPGLSAVDRIAEMEEAIKALEAENARLKEENKRFAEMKVEFDRGGFEEVIRGKDEVIAVQATRIERESKDKVGWKNSSDMWRKRAEESGWTNDVLIDINPREAAHG